jgi:Rho-binding antiterminator
MGDDEYHPIDCAVYSAYELATLHRQRLRVGWRGEDGLLHQEVLLPQDLVTRAGAEYLIATNADGRRLELRLDRIIGSARL